MNNTFVSLQDIDLAKAFDENKTLLIYGNIWVTEELQVQNFAVGKIEGCDLPTTVEDGGLTLDTIRGIVPIDYADIYKVMIVEV